MKNLPRTGEESSVIKANAMFSGLTDGEIGSIARIMSRRSWEKDEAIFLEGETGSELLVVLSGCVAVSVRTDDAEDVELTRVGAGAFFGEMAILEKAPRSATCIAVETTECLVLASADFEKLIVANGSIAAKILERMLVMTTERLTRTGSFLAGMVRWGDEARKRAITDQATGLFNRRYLEDSFNAVVAKCRREGLPFSFAMFDLDRFGSLNAQYGAAFCDRMIVDISAVFRSCFSVDDILVRYGGDEFCFILFGKQEATEARCESVRAAINDLRLEGVADLRVTCSIGIAHFPSGAESQEQLRERADKALYAAKEAGRNRVIAWPGRPVAGTKRDLPTVARKNAVIANFKRAFEERKSFLVVGHRNPDEDCVSSMVAFALIAVKFGRKAAIAFGQNDEEHFSYLLNICRYNGIAVVRDGPFPACDALVLVDTPKPSMMERGELFDAIRADPAVLKLELDHHLGADSRYFGDEGYRLVYEASSTCETIGLLALKLAEDKALLKRYQIDELLSRNLVLAIITGMISDSQMGRYLKTKREGWFYRRFSALFEAMLARKTRSGSANFSSKEEVFKALASLSKDEDACFQLLASRAEKRGRVFHAVVDAATSASMFSSFGNDTAITVSKALVDRLAEESGFIGLVGYFDDPAISDFVQFRMRRSEKFTALDLRSALERFGIANGGGHPGAVGFRIERGKVEDIESTVLALSATLEGLIDEALSAPP